MRLLRRKLVPAGGGSSEQRVEACFRARGAKSSTALAVQNAHELRADFLRFRAFRDWEFILAKEFWSLEQTARVQGGLSQLEPREHDRMR